MLKLREKALTFLKNDFVKNVITLISGTSAGQIIPILISPILTRIYRPEDFAILGVYMSVAVVLSEVVTGKFELAIMNTGSHKDLNETVLLAIIVIITASSVFHALFQMFFERIPFLALEGSEEWKYLLALTIALLGFNKLLLYLNLKKKRFKEIAYSKVSRALSLSTFQLSFFFLSYFGLIIGYLTSLIGEGILLKRKNSISIKGVTVADLKRTFYNHRKFPLFEVPSSLLNIGTIQAPIILIPTQFGSVFGGFYFQAYKILTMPISLIGGAIGQVFMEKASEIKEDLESLSKLIFSTHQRLLAIIIIPISLLSIFGDDLFAFVFGSNWRIAGEYAMVMSPWILMNFLVSPISTIVMIKEKQNIGFIFISVMSFLRILALMVGFLVYKDAYFTVLLFSLASAISYILYSTFLVLRFTNFGLWKYWSIVLKYGFLIYGILAMIKFIFGLAFEQ